MVHYSNDIDHCGFESGKHEDAIMDREHAIKVPIDKGGRRIPDTDRRAYAYTAHIPERRKGGDRRSGKDRRKH